MHRLLGHRGTKESWLILDHMGLDLDTTSLLLLGGAAARFRLATQVHCCWVVGVCMRQGVRFLGDRDMTTVCKGENFSLGLTKLPWSVVVV